MNCYQMNNDQWLRQTVIALDTAGIATARLDAIVLLEDITGKDRSWLLAHPEYKLTSEQVSKLTSAVERRIKHEPMAYIRGKSEFYGREFIVSKDTLEPRPETETMVELLKEILNSQKLYPLQDSLVTERQNVNLRIVDIGTGSGCLAITAKLEFPGTEVAATDISPACIKIANQNAKNLSAHINFFIGNLLESLPQSSFSLHNAIILANLPYVPDSHTINQAAMFEPKSAIFGGEDGLDLYRRLFEQIISLNQTSAYLLTESLPFQHNELAAIALSAGYRLRQTADFIQVFQRAT